MENTCIAALDIGTSAVKVCLFTPSMELLACSVREYALDTRGHRVEARGSQYLDAVSQGIREAMAQAGDVSLAALGITTQGETLAPVDETGTPLRPFLVWLDSRAEPQAAALRESISETEFYRTTGLPEISGALPLAKLRWIREEEPDIYEKSHKFLLVEDYLLHFLTGNFVTEKSLQTSTGWFDLQTDGYWDKALAAAGIHPDKLPRLLECGAPAGHLRQDAADLLGLPPGIPVFTGAMDQTAAALAAGCTAPGTVTETTGSALVMAACTEAPVFARGHHVTIYRHALPGKFIYLPIGNTGGLALKWFRDEFCRDLPGGGEGFAAISAMVSAVSPGCEGLTFLPFLSGSVDPDTCPQARACFFGAELGTTRAHFARAVMESIAFLLRDFSAMLRELDCPSEQICSLGGGSRSEVWMQIKADVCGQSFAAAPVSEATAMGAALLTAWGAGLLAPGVIPQPRGGRVYTPDPRHREIYETAYSRYKTLYQAVKPLFS